MSDCQSETQGDISLTELCWSYEIRHYDSILCINWLPPH